MNEKIYGDVTRNALKEELIKYTDENIDFLIPKYLYKYCSISDYVINNIEQGEISCVPMSRFNDVYDCRIYINSAKNYDKEQLNTDNKLRNILGDEYTSTSRDRNVRKIQRERYDEYVRSNLLSNFRILSLTSTNDNVLMWSHYGGSNTGICIEYETAKMNQKIVNEILPVIYVDKPIDVTDLCINDNRVELASYISMFTKSYHWRYENEWRISTYIGNYTIEFLPLRIGKPTAVYFGTNVFEKLKSDKAYRENFENLLSILDNQQTHLYLMKVNYSNYKLYYEHVTAKDINEQIKSF